eukprot:1646424-Prymnesium_polylepis.1
MVNARTQTPILMRDQISVGTQAPSSQIAAAAAAHQRVEQQQMQRRMQESAEQRAREDCLPVLARAVAVAERAERVATQKQADAHNALEA